MVKYSTTQLNTIFSALSDPTRRAIVENLVKGESSVTELAKPFAMSLPAISKHLRILENAGLLVRHKVGRVHHLRLNAQPLSDALRWMEYYHQFWESRFDELEHQLTKSRK
ncbi:MAG TPA: metalloregulator ArsR/SmtB family transcription factor [Bacteroidota bacterium]